MGYSNKWKEILDEIADFEDSSINKSIWFRGHGNSDYRLLSGLYRTQGFNENLDNYSKYEKDLYKGFLDWGYLQHKERDWNLLYLMQHHGVKTRLLDWSESISIALHFAFSGWNPEQKNSCIWLLDPYKLNFYSLGNAHLYSPTFKYEQFLKEPNLLGRTVALAPTKSTERMISQQGVFTIQGRTLSGLDEELNLTFNSSASECLKRIVLTDEVFEDVQRYLKHSGVNPFIIFSDLGGLARYVNDSLIPKF